MKFIKKFKENMCAAYYAAAHTTQSRISGWRISALHFLRIPTGYSQDFRWMDIRRISVIRIFGFPLRHAQISMTNLSFWV